MLNVWSRQFVCVASALAVMCGNAHAQEPKPPDNPYLALIEEARAAPVEVFADIAFRIINKLPPAVARSVYEEVFRRADEAREPFPLQYAIFASQSERQVPLRTARDLGLDALSLRCRPVLGLLPRDTRLARELFDQIPALEIPRTSCDGDFAPDAGTYIRTLAALVSTEVAFTPEERTKQVPWLMVERAAYGLSSSWEIVAAAKELPRFARTEKQAAILASALATALAISDSDRAYTSAARTGGLVDAVLAAADKLSPAGNLDPGVLAGLRGYLVRHLSATRCEDLITPPQGGWTPKAQSVIPWVISKSEGIDSFDRAVRYRSDIPPIACKSAPQEPVNGKAIVVQAGDLKPCMPAKLEGKAAPPEYANEAEYGDLTSGIAMLTSHTADERAAGAEIRFREMLSKIENLHGAPGQGALEVFHQKCRLLASLAKAAGEGNTGRAVLNARIALLEDSAVLERSPAQWLVELQALASEPRIYVYVHTSPDAPSSRIVHRSGADIIPALAASRVSAVSLYGRLALLREGAGKP